MNFNCIMKSNFKWHWRVDLLRGINSMVLSIMFQSINLQHQRTFIYNLYFLLFVKPIIFLFQFKELPNFHNKVRNSISIWPSIIISLLINLWRPSNNQPMKWNFFQKSKVYIFNFPKLYKQLIRLLIITLEFK